MSALASVVGRHGIIGAPPGPAELFFSMSLQAGCRTLLLLLSLQASGRRWCIGSSRCEQRGAPHSLPSRRKSSLAEMLAIRVSPPPSSSPGESRAAMHTVSILAEN